MRNLRLACALPLLGLALVLALPAIAIVIFADLILGMSDDQLL